MASTLSSTLLLQRVMGQGVNRLLRRLNLLQVQQAGIDALRSIPLHHRTSEVWGTWQQSCTISSRVVFCTSHRLSVDHRQRLFTCCLPGEVGHILVQPLTIPNICHYCTVVSSC